MSPRVKCSYSAPGSLHITQDEVSSLGQGWEPSPRSDRDLPTPTAPSAFKNSHTYAPYLDNAVPIGPVRPARPPGSAHSRAPRQRLDWARVQYTACLEYRVDIVNGVIANAYDACMEFAACVAIGGDVSGAERNLRGYGPSGAVDFQSPRWLVLRPPGE